MREWNAQKTDLLAKLHDNRGQNNRYAEKVPDEKIKEMLKGLGFNIGQFIDKYLQGIPDTTDQELGPIWRKLTPNAHNFLKAGILRDWIFEAYIWEWLRCTVFSPDSQLWGGELGSSFNHIFLRARGEFPRHIMQCLSANKTQQMRSKSPNIVSSTPITSIGEPAQATFSLASATETTVLSPVAQLPKPWS